MISSVRGLRGREGGGWLAIEERKSGDGCACFLAPPSYHPLSGNLSLRLVSFLHGSAFPDVMLSSSLSDTTYNRHLLASLFCFLDLSISP